jgi:hypothetical protein
MKHPFKERTCSGPSSGSGADGRIRTADQLITNQLLYQLSYIGTFLSLEEPPVKPNFDRFSKFSCLD